jgi:hypothetical protein
VFTLSVNGTELLRKHGLNLTGSVAEPANDIPHSNLGRGGKMSALNEAGFSEPSYAAHVWLGEPPWTSVHPVWKDLTDQRSSSSALFQSPSYFEFLAKVAGPHHLDLLTIQDQATRKVVGVSPVQKSLIDVPFSIGSRTMFKARIPCLRILGSEPLIPKTPEAHDQLFALIDTQYPDLSAVVMDAVDVDSFLWRYLFSSKIIRKNHVAYVLHGVQPCHFIYLPPSIAEYRRRLGRKHRHNLERQQRVLERHLNGPLTLTLLTQEEQVPLFVRAMKALGGPGSDAEIMRSSRIGARIGFHHSFVLQCNDRIVGLVTGCRSNGTYRVQ